MSQRLQPITALVAVFTLLIAICVGFSHPAYAAGSVTILQPEPGSVYEQSQTLQIVGTASGDASAVAVYNDTYGFGIGSLAPVTDGVWAKSFPLFQNSVPGPNVYTAYGYTSSGAPAGGADSVIIQVTSSQASTRSQLPDGESELLTCYCSKN